MPNCVGEYSRFSVRVRCLNCKQVVPAVPERGGVLMWQHKLSSGDDCPAWKVGTGHEPVNAQEKRERLERERLERARMPAMGGCNHSAPTPHWVSEARDRERRAEAHSIFCLDDEYSGDYRDRRMLTQRPRSPSSAPA